MKLPKNWNNISIDQFAEINEAPERHCGLFSLGAWVLSVLLDCETEELEDNMSAVELAQKFQEIKWVLEEPKGKLLPEIVIDEVSYKLKPFILLSFGEAIDAFSILERESKYEDMAALLYRKWMLNEWGHVIFEPRGYNEKERAEWFKSFSVGEICEVVNTFKAFNSDLRSRYSELFDDPDPDDKDEDFEPWQESDEEDEEERETMESKREKARAEARKKNGWFLLALDFAGNDPVKLEEVFKLPFAYVINILAIKHEIK